MDYLKSELKNRYLRDIKVEIAVEQGEEFEILFAYPKKLVLKLEIKIKLQIGENYNDQR